MPPTISVLMSCLNSEKTIKKSIDSILSQTYDDFEFIIIDDASDDSTFEILINAARDDKRMRVYKNEFTLGLPSNLNTAFKKSSGSLIARMDADDISYRNRFERQVEYFKNNVNLNVLGTAAHYRSAQHWNEVTTVEMPLTDHEIRKFMFKSSPFIHPTVMMRREFLETVGGYDEKLLRAQDYELWLRGRKKGCYENTPDVLLQYTHDAKKSQKAILQTFLIKIRSDPNMIEFLQSLLYSIYELATLIYFRLNNFIEREK